MAGQWMMSVAGRFYGPFSGARMEAFAVEGRLAATSLVAREENSDWHEAGAEPEFAHLFAARPEQAAEAAPAAVIETPVPQPHPQLQPQPQPQLQPQPQPEGDTHEGTRSQFAIVVDVKSRGGGDMEQAILSLGPAYRLLPNIWILSTEQTVNAVRNRLVQELGKADSLFVVDASRGKASWFNFGPEADVRIRKVWQKAS